MKIRFHTSSVSPPYETWVEDFVVTSDVVEGVSTRRYFLSNDLIREGFRRGLSRGTCRNIYAMGFCLTSLTDRDSTRLRRHPFKWSHGVPLIAFFLEKLRPDGGAVWRLRIPQATNLLNAKSREKSIIARWKEQPCPTFIWKRNYH